MSPRRFSSGLGWVLMIILSIALLAIVIAAFGALPAALLDRNTSALQLAPTDRIKAETDIRSGLLQAVAGTLLVVGAITAWRQMLTTRRQLFLSRRIATTDAFSKAVDQMSSASISVRLGAIYALDRVAEDDPTEKERVGHLLTTRIRVEKPQDEELNAILAVLSSKKWPSPLNLADSDLEGMRLSHLRLRGVILDAANLSRTDLSETDLRGASLCNTNFRHATITGTDFRTCDMSSAQLSGARASSRTLWPPEFDIESKGIIVE